PPPLRPSPPRRSSDLTRAGRAQRTGSRPSPNGYGRAACRPPSGAIAGPRSTRPAANSAREPPDPRVAPRPLIMVDSTLGSPPFRSEEHTSELQPPYDL